MATVNPISYQAQNASAKAQMLFQERMSNTAHVREVQDLKAAGLNPVLSAGGSGASTPAGAEGYVGDENAKLFDLVANSMNQSAKTLSKAVGSLGRALANQKKNPDGFSLLDFMYNRPSKPSQQLWNMAMTLGDPYLQNGSAKKLFTQGLQYGRTTLDQARSFVSSLNVPSQVSVPVVSVPNSASISNVVLPTSSGEEIIYDSRGVAVGSKPKSNKSSAKKISSFGSAVKKFLTAKFPTLRFLG